MLIKVGVAVTHWVVCILVVLGQWNSYILETEITLNVTLYYVHFHCLYTCSNVHVCHVRCLHHVTLRMEGGGGGRPATADCVDSEYIIAWQYDTNTDPLQI